MQTKDHLNYTNQLPKWAIGFHIGLISFFLLLGIGVFVLSAKEISEMGLGFSIFLFAIGIAFLGISWVGYKNLRKYLDSIIKVQLGDIGYEYIAKDKKLGEEHHIFLPYENMKYILIGMDYRFGARIKYSVNHANRAEMFPVRSAKVLICGVSSDNQLEVTSFSHWEQKSLDKWIDVFQNHGVAIFHTDKALTGTPNNPEFIETIPMKRYEGTLSFVVGSRAEDIDNIYLTNAQQQVLKEKDKKGRRDGFYYTILVALLQIVMICFWFPHWEIVENSFGDSSGEFFALLFTVSLQFFIYMNMKWVKWYEPIRDMLIIYIGILIGSQLSPDGRTAFHSAVQGYAIMTIGVFLCLYYIIKIYSWFQKLSKKVI